MPSWPLTRNRRHDNSRTTINYLHYRIAYSHCVFNVLCPASEKERIIIQKSNSIFRFGHSRQAFDRMIKHKFENLTASDVSCASLHWKKVHTKKPSSPPRRFDVSEKVYVSAKVVPAQILFYHWSFDLLITDTALIAFFGLFDLTEKVQSLSRERCAVYVLE